MKCDVPLPVRYDGLIAPPQDDAQLRSLYEHFGFRTLLRDLNSAQQQSPDRPAAGEGVSILPARPAAEPVHGGDLFDSSGEYETILTDAQLDAWLEKITRAELTSVDTETTGLDNMTAQLVGISFSIEPHHAAYLPLAHRYPGAPDQPGARTRAAKTEALAGKRTAQKARSEPEIRPAHLREPRHRAGGHRRGYAAAILRAGSRTSRTTWRTWRCAISG